MEWGQLQTVEEMPGTNGTPGSRDQGHDRTTQLNPLTSSPAACCLPQEMGDIKTPFNLSLAMPGAWEWVGGVCCSTVAKRP